MTSFDKTTVRRARKDRMCSAAANWCCGSGWIKAGELYNEHVAAPGQAEIGNEH
jgi:hypothetical protein